MEQPVQESPSHPTGERVEQPKRELTFHVASSLEQTLQAWELVYRAYTRIGLIEENPFQLHTVPQAVGEHTITICGTVGDDVVSTLTMIHDSEQGLPLESVYRDELDALRRQGRRLMEICLLADRREHLTRSLPAVLGMMRYVYWRSRHSHFDDIICGIHPHHAQFYMKYYAFEQIGRETVYPTVRNHPVVLLHLDLEAKVKLNPLPRGLALHASEPLEPTAFEPHFVFDLAARQHPRIAGFLGHKGKADAAVQNRHAA